MSDIFGRLKSGAGKVAFEADKVAQIKRIEFDIGQLKRQIEGHYQKLGEITYHNMIDKKQESPESAEICTKITDLLNQITGKEEEIRKLNAETYKPEEDTKTPTQNSTGKKHCTNCGLENEANAKFCSNCGAKMA